MKQLTISEMNGEQLRQVWEHNEGLQNSVYDDAIDGEMHWIEEALDVLKDGLSDWSIGTGAKCYVTPRSAESFIEALGEAQRMFCTLTDEHAPLLVEAQEIVEAYRSEELYTERYYTLDRQLDRITDKLATLVARTFEDALNWHTFDNCRDYFLDFYVSERLDGDEYIELRFDGSTDWKLKKTVTKTF